MKTFKYENHDDKKVISPKGQTKWNKLTRTTSTTFTKGLFSLVQLRLDERRNLNAASQSFWTTVQRFQHNPPLTARLPPPGVLRRHCHRGRDVRGERLWVQEGHRGLQGNASKTKETVIEEETLVQHPGTRHRESEDAQIPECLLKTRSPVTCWGGWYPLVFAGYYRGLWWRLRVSYAAVCSEGGQEDAQQTG